MLFSIIVPVYNAKNYLNKCIDSILNQTNTDFELILVDDGSTPAIKTHLLYHRFIFKKPNHFFRQRFKIMVDDGSTDGSDLICDEYAKTGAKVKVIHKQNP